MQSTSLDRRTSPRFDVCCIGELAWGGTMVEVEIVDMSITGCGIKVPDAAAAGEGSYGVLNIRTRQSELGVVLPVAIINRSVEQGGLRCGLEYRRLSRRQMRSLIALLNEVLPD